MLALNAAFASRSTAIRKADSRAARRWSRSLEAGLGDWVAGAGSGEGDGSAGGASVGGGLGASTGVTAAGATSAFIVTFTGGFGAAAGLGTSAAGFAEAMDDTGIVAIGLAGADAGTAARWTGWKFFSHSRHLVTSGRLV